MHHHASFWVGRRCRPSLHPRGGGLRRVHARRAGHQRQRGGDGDLAENFEDTSQGYPVYRRAALSTPHMQRVHIQHEAFSALTASPPPWTSSAWIGSNGWTRTAQAMTEPSPTSSAPTFTRSRKAVSWSSASGLRTSWRASTHGLPSGESGRAALGQRLDAGQQRALSEVDVIRLPTATCRRTRMHWRCSRSITVWQVHSQRSIGRMPCSRGSGRPMPEVSMSCPGQRLAGPARRNPCSSRRPHPRTVDEGTGRGYHDKSTNRARAFLGPTPPAEPWPAGAYDAYLQWLLDHPSLLLGGFPKRTYRLLGGAFKAHIVHGDVVRLAPALHGSPNTVLAVREGLGRKGGPVGAQGGSVNHWNCRRLSRG